jgi:hypothetical protein
VGVEIPYDLKVSICMAGQLHHVLSCYLSPDVCDVSAAVKFIIDVNDVAMDRGVGMDDDLVEEYDCI